MWGEQLIKSWFSTFRAKDKQPTERVKKTILYSSRSNYYVINLVNCNKSITFAHQKGWFRSSVGLEQQPSKLWVLGSNPNGITLLKVPILLGFRYFPFFRFTAVKLFGNKKNAYSVQIWTAKQVFSIRLKF